ncbi:hypothetical protein [Runella zeae]|uniref:hypothetical protein n=1 Tax=Runella zeae TaxID=94255 RepID=UPI0004063662|nr:hypothetical protein [Runella zeae]
MITKAQILESIQSLPEDATADDIIENIIFLKKIERSLEQANAGETYSLEEMKKMVHSWQKHV